MMKKMEDNFLKSKEQFKDICEELFKSTSPHVDKDEARAGVLGFHPLALLVLALDYIEDLEDQLKSK